LLQKKKRLNFSNCVCKAGVPFMSKTILKTALHYETVQIKMRKLCPSKYDIHV